MVDYSIGLCRPTDVVYTQDIYFSAIDINVIGFVNGDMIVEFTSR